MVTHGEIAHYTYWYDHPFLGWALVAGYAWLTDGFDRVPSAVMVGREFMLVCVVASAALLYVLARRLGLHRVTAAVAVLAFGLSPLAVYLHRMVFLDNIAVVWMLAALVFAASPRRSLAAAFGSAACFAAATLSKETIALLLPAVAWVLVQHGDRRTRRWSVGVFATTYLTLVAAYPMFALLKNELLPGPGHVSLGWAVYWQLVGRDGGGSLLAPASATSSLVHSWLRVDAWLLIGGLLMAPVGLVVRRLRPVAFALVLQVLVMCRGGYVPQPYAIAFLPFAALLVAGAADLLWRPVDRPWRERVPTWARAVLRRAGWPPLIAGALACVVLVAPAWIGKLREQATTDGSAASRAATRWVLANVPRTAVVVVDDYVWLDLVRNDFANTVWLFKLDSDPEVMRTILPDGYASIDYIVLPDQPHEILDSRPTLTQALQHSHRVATFDGMNVRRVIAGP